MYLFVGSEKEQHNVIVSQSVFFMKRNYTAANQHLKDTFALFALMRLDVCKQTPIYSSHTQTRKQRVKNSPLHWYADAHMHKHKQAP